MTNEQILRLKELLDAGTEIYWSWMGGPPRKIYSIGESPCNKNSGEVIHLDRGHYIELKESDSKDFIMVERVFKE